MHVVTAEATKVATTSLERDRRVALTALGSALAKGIAIVTMLLSVPLAVGYLGSERYGLWLTISSFIAVLGFADLGLSEGLLNALSEANGHDDIESARQSVSSAWWLLLGIALILAAGFALIYARVPWPHVFNVSSAQAAAEAGPALVVFIGCFVVTMPLDIVQRIQLAYQEGYANSRWQALGSLLALVSVLLAIHMKAGLPWLVLAVAGAPVVATFFNGVMLFGFQRPWLRPRWKKVNGAAARKLFRLGILFFILQMTIALAYASDNLIAAQLLGPAAVTQYAVTMRLFSIAPMILGLWLSPLWPAYGEAIARGDQLWVQQTLSKSLRMALLVTVVPSALLIVLGAPIVTRWVGPEVVPSYWLLFGYGVWTVMSALGNALAMFLNAANVIRFQVASAALMAVSAWLMKIYLAQRIGLPGMIWATLIAYTIFTALPMLIYVPSVLATMNRRGTSEVLATRSMW